MRLSAAALASAVSSFSFPRSASAIAPPWQYSGFARFPSFYFGATESGPQSSAELAYVRRNALAGGLSRLLGEGSCFNDRGELVVACLPSLRDGCTFRLPTVPAAGGANAVPNAPVPTPAERAAVESAALAFQLGSKSPVVNFDWEAFARQVVETPEIGETQFAQWGFCWLHEPV